MSRIRYAVPMVSQSTSPVCWLACAIMLLQRNGQRSIDTDEIDYINGDPRMASFENVDAQRQIEGYLIRWGFRVRRIRQVHVPMLSYDSPGRNPTEPQAMVWNSRDKQVIETIILATLRNFGPFILFHRCGTFSYGPNRSMPSSGNHAVLITGIDTDRKICYFNNPWGDINVPTSIRSIVGAIRDWETRYSNPSVAYLV